MAKKNFKNGFTLIEMMVSIFIFSLLVGAASGLFVLAIRNQSRALASQQILSQTSYLIEYMGRAIRMAQKELKSDAAERCLSSGYGYNYETNPAGNKIRFINYNNQCQEFYLEGNQIKEKKSTDHKAINLPAEGTSLTSPDLQVVSFRVNLSGESQDDDFQPRVIIFLEIRKSGPEPQPKIKIQTTISQRNPDIELK